ncbi:outer membrane lipoprotein carrier protein LolA [Colwellia sp. Arc7-635]|uniref:outer membrane lipoprotein chaperone LolA n=1 Tax=Colwellia sp. Arc7-635 TaxID=2497879 RepID=UPI000F859DA0|nr:outer membrane lipoprotein chaperone LolA [Colwellia sp. Arc7-635]AZQ84561.1 outer membrane lipoprotein carrier protein LolA [Colwellia sp. Arc7-635]
MQSQMQSKMKLIKSSVAIAAFLNLALSTSSVAATANHAVVAELKTSALTELTAADNTMGTVSIDKNIINSDSSVDKSKLELMAILAKVEFFSAEFNQQIFDEAGTELQQGSGLLSVSKPNLVNWQTVLPDESLIVSDGSNLWFYDPFVEQVSVYSLESAIANTPILLITSNDAKLWQDYSVSKLSDNRYLISAINENSRVKSLALNFSQHDDKIELSSFNILDATGQLSVITLTHKNQIPDASLFEFSVPEGVYLDDQR